MAATTEQKAVGFGEFGGLRLDQALDEVGANASIYEHDIERDGSVGNFRSRDGFQKLNASAASGEYKGLYPHSALRLLAIKRVSGSEAKVVAINKEGTEVTTNAVNSTEAPSTFASIGTPSGTFTYLRTNVAAQKVIEFDGTTFTEPTCTIENVNAETGERTLETGKEYPRGRHMVGWPDANNVLVVANCGATGGPNGAASSASEVWISRPMPATVEAIRFDPTENLILGAGDGEEITGLCVYAAQLYVFKETKFFVVSPPESNEHGQAVFSFREVTLGQGSHIKQVLTEKLKETSDRICWASQDGVFFCTTDGIYQSTGSQPTKISPQLKPLEETVPFEGPMAEFLNGETESFRWPAVGICVLGRRIYCKRYEFMFIYDIDVETWTCWKMPSVSMAIWTGLTGGGAESAADYAATVEDNSGVGTKAWSEPSKAEGAPDGQHASASVASGKSGVTTHYLKATNFGFSIPTGATIVGIELSVIREGDGVTESHVRAVKAGVVKETEDKSRGAFWIGAGTSVYGGSEDLWGNTWAPSDINATGFGVAVAVELRPTPLSAAEAQVDAMQVKIYYLSAEQSSGVRPRLFCSQTKTVFWNGPKAEEQATFPGWAWQSGLYDLGSEDEKELVKSKLWAAGTIDVATSKDFKPIEARKVFTMGEETTQKQNNISDKGTLFSHRFSGTGKASVQKFVRYLRTTATSGSQSDPS